MLRDAGGWYTDLFRVESRNIFYGGAGSGTSSTVRLRNRLELLVPLNKERLSDDGARYLLADWEWFAPVDEPNERFANKQRIRALPVETLVQRSRSVAQR